MSDSAVAADVLVVGAGPSGAIVAHTLAGAGFSTVVLEQGDWINPTDYPGSKPEWELLCQQQWHHDPNVRRRPSDYPLDVANSDMHPVMFNAVGGGSIHYAADWPRLAPSDFCVRSLDGVADDWPISYRDLQPYYERIDHMVGISGLAGDPAYPDGGEYALLPTPMGKVGRKAVEGLNKLEWHWWPGAKAIPSRKFGRMEQCARWGTCERGCPESAKASFDLAVWPDALERGVNLVTGARVRQILTDENGLATGALYVDRDGKEVRQKASVVVMAANGVGTPRLLLLSESRSHPNGLANSSDLVGRNLMLHPNCSVTGFYEEDIESWRGPAAHLIVSLEFYETDLSRGFVRGAKLHAYPLAGALSVLEAHSGLPFDQKWGQGFHNVASRTGHAMLWAANTEDLPEPSNRVTLSGTLVDGDGIPAPAINYRISENTRRIMKFSIDRMRQAHVASGAVATFDTDLWIDEPGHLLGTARMGADPSTSVVDQFGRAHDVPNLFVVDGSIFVTSGAMNPTSTITALALRIAEHMVANARDQKVPV